LQILGLELTRGSALNDLTAVPRNAARYLQLRERESLGSPGKVCFSLATLVSTAEARLQRSTATLA
jgi:hypothetical protein